MRSGEVDISVVIPTYNRKEYLHQAIVSCFDGNDGLGVEVVVVDDGSNDGTREYLEGLEESRVRPIFQEHHGGQVARNRGLTEARGEYVKFLDDDDWLAHRALEREVGVLRESGAEACSGGCQFVDQTQSPLGEPDLDPSGDMLLKCIRGDIGPQPLRHTYRRELVAGLTWDEALPCRQDFAFLLEVASQSPDHVCTEKISGYKRQHSGGLSERKRSKEHAAKVHLNVLSDAVRRIMNTDRMGADIRRAAAQKLWVWGRIVAMEDWREFERTNVLIERLLPEFVPGRKYWLLKMLDKLFGRVRTERIIHPVRKAVNVRA
jgi:glycosyltransferase involved in cell wall biosynthesis